MRLHQLLGDGLAQRRARNVWSFARAARRTLVSFFGHSRSQSRFDGPQSPGPRDHDSSQLTIICLSDKLAGRVVSKEQRPCHRTPSVMVPLRESAFSTHPRCSRAPWARCGSVTSARRPQDRTTGRRMDPQSESPRYVSGISPSLLGLNRNKRSVTLDFKDPGRELEVLDALVASRTCSSRTTGSARRNVGVGYEASARSTRGWSTARSSGTARKVRTPAPRTGLVLQGYSGSLWAVGRATTRQRRIAVVGRRDVRATRRRSASSRRSSRGSGRAKVSAWMSPCSPRSWTPRCRS